MFLDKFAEPEVNRRCCGEFCCGIEDAEELLLGWMDFVYFLVHGLLLTSLALLCATGTGYYFLYEMFGEQCDFNRYVIYGTCAVSVVSVILSLFPRFASLTNFQHSRDNWWRALAGTGKFSFLVMHPVQYVLCRQNLILFAVMLQPMAVQWYLITANP
ncbi:unnamed protein product [Notodromas monacha]|uniref:Uncharacterized protein n=1 Tax=Notodromas monacha TaxID=399045 RepID=A0A7R9BLM7_9CRUS|nr:unnamed protein product [Notodromas monacha]CAG0916916.1 unnamed protein product [Notodromas monacha]